MNQMIRTLAFALAVSAPLANAGVLLEPFAGYHVGTQTEASKADQKYKTAVYGARAGLQKLGLMAGVEYSTGEGARDEGSPKPKLTPTTLGAFVGYEFPLLLRVYGTYGFDSKLKSRADNVTTEYAGGNLIKVGVGFTSLPFVALNLEYTLQTFTKSDGAKLANEIKSSAYGLSLSFPLSL